MAGGPRVLIRELDNVDQLLQELQNNTALTHRKTRFYGPMWDLVHLVRWAPDQTLQTSIAAIGERLALPHPHIVGGLLGCLDDWHLTSDQDPWTLDAHGGLELKQGVGPYAKYQAQQADR